MSKCKLDLGLLVDTTRSIKYENLPKLKEALVNLVNQFDVSPDGTHISLETFDRTSTLHNKFNDSRYHSNKAINDLITRNLTKLRQPTRLVKAIGTAKNLMFTKQSGQRAGVRSVMVLFTDGKSHADTEDFFLDIVALKASSLLSSFIYTIKDHPIYIQNSLHMPSIKLPIYKILVLVMELSFVDENASLPSFFISGFSLSHSLATPTVNGRLGNIIRCNSSGRIVCEGIDCESEIYSSRTILL